jgi:SAM-dependent methyltransferase
MRATRIGAAGPEDFGKLLAVRDVELSGRRAGEVLVRLAACVECRNGLSTVSGEDPFGSAPTALGREVRASSRNDPRGPSRLAMQGQPRRAVRADAAGGLGIRPPQPAFLTAMVATDLLAFVRGNLPAPPLRLLEIGAGDGGLARALAGIGYEVVAIDPGAAGADVRPVALHELDEPSGSFDAALAVTSLHHVDPLDGSLTRLAELIRPGGLLVVDEFDVAVFDERAAGWWLRQRQALGAAEHADAKELVGEHRAHLHPLERIVAALEPHFQLGTPLYGAYLYRWDLDESLRYDEEDAIARAEIPAVGARLIARRNV